MVRRADRRPCFGGIKEYNGCSTSSTLVTAVTAMFPFVQPTKIIGRGNGACHGLAPTMNRNRNCLIRTMHAVGFRPTADPPTPHEKVT